MEVAPFFVDFHHFLSIFTIFYQFSRFTHFCRDLHFVAILRTFSADFFWPKYPSPQHHTFFACMIVTLFYFHSLLFQWRRKVSLRKHFELRFIAVDMVSRKTLICCPWKFQCLLPTKNFRFIKLWLKLPFPKYFPFPKYPSICVK